MNKNCDELKINTYICICIHVHEPKCGSVTSRTVSTFRISFHGLVNINFSVLCEVFLKFRKFCQWNDNYGEKR